MNIHSCSILAMIGFASLAALPLLFSSGRPPVGPPLPPTRPAPTAPVAAPASGPPIKRIVMKCFGSLEKLRQEYKKQCVRHGETDTPLEPDIFESRTIGTDEIAYCFDACDPPEEMCIRDRIVAGIFGMAGTFLVFQVFAFFLAIGPEPSC